MSKVTSRQLRSAVQQELERVATSKGAAMNGPLPLRSAAWADYKTGAGRLRSKAAALLPSMGQQYDWCNANPHHPEHDAIADSFTVSAAIYHHAHKVADEVDGDKLAFGDRRFS